MAVIFAVAACATASPAGATEFNWLNQVVSSGAVHHEGINHHTVGTRVNSTGPFACVGVTNNYWVCSDANHGGIQVGNFAALGDPECGNGDIFSHYYHCYWSS